MLSAARDRTARARIREYLVENGPVTDDGGRATALLKDAVGYSGTAVAFIQLLSAMDRDNEIVREIRGKRTYRVSTPARAVARGTAGTMAMPLQVSEHRIAIDYDELAHALVRAIARIVASASPSDELAGAVAERERILAERDEYARLLDVARRQLSALINEPVASATVNDPAVMAEGRSLLSQLANAQSVGRAEQAS